MGDYDRELGQIQESLKNLGKSLDAIGESFTGFTAEVRTYIATSSSERQKLKADVEVVATTLNTHLDEHGKREKKVYRNVTIVVAVIAALAEAGQLAVMYFRGR